MKPKYEEKTYETYFNIELARRSQVFFPPGQVQEGFLGFDAATLSFNRSLWRRFGYPFWFFPEFDGIRLRDIERYMGQSLDELPPFKANLLFQYKRPEHITRSSGNEWHHWNQPYFRYDIYQQQQTLLMQIHQQFGSRALVLYAAPAIFDMIDLVTKSRAGRIIASSNFQECHLLDGHDHNTYIEAGTCSIACSEPENLENIDLLVLLQQLGNDSRKEESNTDFIINFRNQLIEMMNENNEYAAAFKLMIDANDYKNYPLINSFFVLQQFKWLTGIQWLINF